MKPWVLLQDAVWAFLLSPIVIAIHRFVILGEVTPNYGLDVGEPAFRLMFIWLFGLRVFSGLPYTLLGALQALGFSPLATAIPFAIALIVAPPYLRLTILYPAIAVEAPARHRPACVRRHQRSGAAHLRDLPPRAHALDFRRYHHRHPARAWRTCHRLRAGDDQFGHRRRRTNGCRLLVSGHRFTCVHGPCRAGQERRRALTPEGSGAMVSICSCPLWVNSGHFEGSALCPLCPHRRGVVRRKSRGASADSPSCRPVGHRAG